MIRPEEYPLFGIDPSDIPLGTFPALDHPSQLPSSYGGNAYGFGIFESHDRLNHKEIQFIQSIAFEDPEEVRKHYKRLNELYRKIGLLIRISTRGKPYYLIPVHLVSSSLSHIQSKLNEIEKIIQFHKRKYLKEHYGIGLMVERDDFIVRELSLRFKEHRFFILDSLDRLNDLKEELDLVILTEDLYAVTLMEISGSIPQKTLTKARLNQYALYILWKLYGLLVEEGELFVIAERYSSRTNRTAKVIFKNVAEQKNFFLFTHLFRTRRRYRSSMPAIEVNVFDFQKYLSGLYLEPKVVNDLLGGKNLDDINLIEIAALPHADIEFEGPRFFRDQGKAWDKLLSVFFHKIFLKPLIPQPIKRGWRERFSFVDYTPHYMLIYLGQKKPLPTAVNKVQQDVARSSLAGCHMPFLAEYRNSFDFVIRTLEILNDLKKRPNEGLPQILLDRLTQPLENKARRFGALNDVLRLMDKIPRLQRIEECLNPNGIEGPRTRILEDLKALPFFGLPENEIREIVLVVTGHSPMGRVISGKLNEKSLKGLSELARRYDRRQALNLLRYCRLMTLAETVAAKGSPITKEQLAELFEVYETVFRIVTNKELDWDSLMDEKISVMGGIRNKLIHRILMMTDHFEFLQNWSELPDKGRMEKETLADYDGGKLSRIEDVIKLVDTIQYFERTYLHSDPLRLPAFCRKFLDIEFHGTTHLFKRVDIRLAFILFWITVNLVRGQVINFNPILAAAPDIHPDELLRNVEKEAKDINIQYLDLPTLEQFGKQLYRHGSAFIVGTGFQLRINPKTEAMDMDYVDLDKDIHNLQTLTENLEGQPISEMSIHSLENLEKLFSNLESFHQSHIRLLEQLGSNIRLPSKQRKRYQYVRRLREKLWINFQRAIFHPEDFYTDISRLYKYAPSVMTFLSPELMALRGVTVPGRVYLKSSILEYILATARKMQALVHRDRKGFQNVHLLHSLAQREFGPMATGIIGVNEDQMDLLEHMVERLRRSPALFDALIRSFIFQDLGRVQTLREKYDKEYDPADFSQAGAFFLEMEGLAKRYALNGETEEHLRWLIRNHSLLHHILRGEIAFAALKDILSQCTRDIFDAFFVFSFVMLSAIREDLMLEDLAGRLFQVRAMCIQILEGTTTFDQEMSGIFLQKGDLYHALEDYQMKGLPERMSPAEYVASHRWGHRSEDRRIVSGTMIFALERLFRLRGIRYVEFDDLVQFTMKIPLRFIYNKHCFSSIGYATFEKELFEALRIYNTLLNLAEPARHFILEQLSGDRVRIFGYEKISSYLSYENQIKLLLIGLLGTAEMDSEGDRATLNFLSMDEDIPKRYEAVNEFFNRLHIEKIWGMPHQTGKFFKARTGIRLSRQWKGKVISVEFHDRINIDQKVAHMNTIRDVGPLKNYFHYSLRSLRKYHFNTDDYDHALESAFGKRLQRIVETLLDQAKQEMALIVDFEELYRRTMELEARSLELGFTEDQRHRLTDIYELRKDQLRREKLSEIQRNLGTIGDRQGLEEYWSSAKGYLLRNRAFLGKEFETLVAKQFDEVSEHL